MGGRIGLRGLHGALEPAARAALRGVARIPRGAHWLDVGCGTGALTAAICGDADPASAVGCDPSEAFIEFARGRVSDSKANFRVAKASALRATRADTTASHRCSRSISSRHRGRPSRDARIRRGRRHGLRVRVGLRPRHGDAPPVLGLRGGARWRGPRAPRRGAIPTLPSRGAREGVRRGEAARHPVRAARDPNDLLRLRGLLASAPRGRGQFPPMWRRSTRSAARRWRSGSRASLARGSRGEIALKARAWAVRGIAG